MLLPSKQTQYVHINHKVCTPPHKRPKMPIITALCYSLHLLLLCLLLSISQNDSRYCSCEYAQSSRVRLRSLMDRRLFRAKSVCQSRRQRRPSCSLPRLRDIQYIHTVVQCCERITLTRLPNTQNKQQRYHFPRSSQRERACVITDFGTHTKNRQTHGPVKVAVPPSATTWRAHCQRVAAAAASAARRRSFGFCQRRALTTCRGLAFAAAAAAGARHALHSACNCACCIAAYYSITCTMMYKHILVRL